MRRSASPVTLEVDGLRFGCAMGIEVHYPEVFAEYERLDIDNRRGAVDIAPRETQGGSAVTNR